MGKRVPIPICGPAYKHPVQEVSNQRCVNMFLSYPNASSDVDKNNPLEQGRGSGCLIPTMGNHILSTPSVTGNCRGVFTVAITHNTSYTFWVMGNRVIQMRTIANPSGFSVFVLSGTLPDSAGSVVMTCNQKYLMITKSDADGSSKWGYYYDYTVSVGTGTVTAIVDADFPGGTHVVMIDGYFIVNQPSSSTLACSDLNNPAAWTATNVAQTNGYPDNLVGLGQTKNEIWAFGAASIEVWYDAGNNPGFPFSKRVGSDMGVGCSAPYSIITANDKIYWIDSRRFVAQSDFSTFFRNQSSGYQIAKISTEAIDVELNSYSIIQDAVSSTYIDNGHVMVEWTFPTAQKTWTFDTTTGLWHEKAALTTSQTLTNNKINYYTTIGNNTYGGSLQDHTIYQLNRTMFDDNGTPIPRIRTTQIFTDDFNEITINELEIKCKTGTSPISTVTNVVPAELLTTSVVGFIYVPSGAFAGLVWLFLQDPIQDYTTDSNLNIYDTVDLYAGYTPSPTTLPQAGGTKLYNPVDYPGWLNAADLIAYLATVGITAILVGTGNNNGLQINNLPNASSNVSVGNVVILNGYNTITTSTSVPVNLSLQYSNDSGYTYGNRMVRGMGMRGERNKRLIWGPWGSSREWSLYLSITDAADFAIVDAAAIIDIEGIP